MVAINTMGEEFENGKPPYPKTLLISTQRSGCNLVRHVCETMAGQRTPGKVHILSEGPFLFHRTHWVGQNLPRRAFAPLFDNSGTALYENVVLILRDPMETFVRAYEKNLQKMHYYCDNIIAFEIFKGKKLLVKYDRLITDDGVLLEIFDLLGIGNLFDAGKLKEIRRESVEWYDANQKSKSQTKGDPGKSDYHKSKLTPEEIDLLWRFLEARLGHLIKYVEPWRIDKK